MFYRIIALTLLIVLLTGCAAVPAPSVPKATEPPADTVVTADTVETTTEATRPTEEPTQTTAEITEVTGESTETTAPPDETTIPAETEHSALFIPNVTQDDMVTYFLEVCLDAEIVNSGNANVLQKWRTPIYYHIYGDPTDEDRQVLANMAQWLNTLDGFPGMQEIDEADYSNMRIYFCSQQELLDRMGDKHRGTDGAFTFWYSYDIIFDSIICIRTDLDQELRNSVILEEIYNALGPAQDTDLRQESIIYSGFSQSQALHPIDQVILQLLYHRDLKCGMDAAACADAIRELYY